VVANPDSGFFLSVRTPIPEPQELGGAKKPPKKPAGTEAPAGGL